MNIKVSYGMLETLQERVSQIVEEFEQASARREDCLVTVSLLSSSFTAAVMAIAGSSRTAAPSRPVHYRVR